MASVCLSSVFVSLIWGLVVTLTRTQIDIFIHFHKIKENQTQIFFLLLHLALFDPTDPSPCEQYWVFPSHEFTQDFRENPIFLLCFFRVLWSSQQGALSLPTAWRLKLCSFRYVKCYLVASMTVHIWVWKISHLFVLFEFSAVPVCLSTVSKAESQLSPEKPISDPYKTTPFSFPKFISTRNLTRWSKTHNFVGKVASFGSYYSHLSNELLKTQVLWLPIQTSNSISYSHTPSSLLQNQTHFSKSLKRQTASSSKMQDPTTFQPMIPQFPEQEQLKCPRCDSSNTKFCYYNNYNLSQPRHFCKNCKRYWTKGGSLRNIPIGGGSRKNTKRSSSASKRSSSATNSSSSTVSSSAGTAAAAQNADTQPDRARVYGPKIDQENPMLDISGSFSSLLTSNEQFGSLMDGLNPHGSGLKLMQMGDFGENVDSSGHGLNSDPGLEVQSNGNPESYMGLQNGDSSCWNGSNGWPDLAIYTPGSSFQ